MNIFNDLFKFGMDIKSKAGLYCVGLLFIISGVNLLFGFETISIYIIFEMMFICVFVSLIEYCLFRKYDDLSRHKKNINTLIWAVLTNILVLGSGWYFNWVSHLPLTVNITLIIMFEIALIAFRYGIYIVNQYETKDLNKKLKSYQNDKSM
ncbi:MAG: hypothetical protein RR585_00150 [Coprobacillus sp.]